MSLQVRLFLQASAVVLLTALALLLIGGHELRRLELEQLDERLCMEARRVASPRRDANPDSVSRLAEDIQFKLRLDAPDQLRLQWLEDVKDREAESGRSRLNTWFGANYAPQWHSVQSRDTPPQGRPDPRGRCESAGAVTGDGDWRVVRVRTRGGIALLAAQTRALEAELGALRQHTLQVMLPLAVVLALGSAWMLSRLMMGPVLRLREAMRKLTPQALSQRLITHGEPREFRELIAAYNTMLDRLEASFRQASRFSADAAHELRTPLTILQGRLERAITATEGRAVQAELGAVLEEVVRLAGIARKLLLLSRADAGRLDLHLEPLNLHDLLTELVGDAHMLAEGRPVRVELPAELLVKGDALLLRQLFNNLLSNALKHGLADGELAITAQARNDGVQVIFSNACNPLSTPERERFFERFYRGDPSHNRQVDGTGLGLSLAREIARAHGGELDLLPTEADRVSLRVQLPR